MVESVLYFIKVVRDSRESGETSVRGWGPLEIRQKSTKNEDEKGLTVCLSWYVKHTKTQTEDNKSYY